MAAGLGFKTFTTGEVLTAADTNGYLMQGVNVFADATARDAAITSPEEGQFAYLKDTNVTTYYTGSAWANLDTTGMTNPMTTTGDIIYSSSGSTPARLGIGTTGQVLSVSGGVPAWGSVGGNDSILTFEESSSYVTNRSVGVSSYTNQTLTTNTTNYYPIFLPNLSVDRISILSGASVSVAGNVRLGLYNASLTTGKPTTVVFDAGTVSVNATSTLFEITISESINSGWYYLALNQQSGTMNFPGFFNQPIGVNTVTTNLSAATLSAIGYREAGVTGAFATAGSLAINPSTTRTAIMGMRIA
jgi:hypothetical protein